MTSEDALRILGLKEGCTAEEIRKAYKEHSFAWHPDRFEAGSSMQERAAARMKEINEAYAILTGKAQSSQSNTGGRPDVLAMEQVVYLGDDPRLGNLGRQKPQIIAAFTSDALLQRFSENLIHAYPRDHILGIVRGDQHHASERASISFKGYDPKDHSCDGKELVIQAKDPEGIESLLIARLRFENDYLAERFAKRVRELCCPRDVRSGHKAYVENQVRQEREREAAEKEKKLEAAVLC